MVISKIHRRWVEGDLQLRCSFGEESAPIVESVFVFRHKRRLRSIPRKPLHYAPGFIRILIQEGKETLLWPNGADIGMEPGG